MRVRGARSREFPGSFPGLPGVTRDHQNHPGGPPEPLFNFPGNFSREFFREFFPGKLNKKSWEILGKTVITWFSCYFRIVLDVFPGIVGETSWNFPEISRNFLGISENLPRHFPDTSRNFQEFSRTFSGTCLEFSWRFPAHCTNMSRKRPGYFPDISWSISGHHQQNLNNLPGGIFFFVYGRNIER